MRIPIHYAFAFLFFIAVNAFAQDPVNEVSFFEDERVVSMELLTDLKTLVNEKEVNKYQPAKITLRFPDSTVITEDIQLSARGEFRRTNCYMPSMKLDFKNPSSLQLARLKKLKMVCGCSRGTTNENLVLKEYLIYKMYNLLTDMSFRVRLLHITYRDTKRKIKPYSQYGFFIEDVDEMAKRNKCYEVENITFHTQSTNRTQMTLVSLFQYMIGNTDWAVPTYHNIKLMRPKKDSLATPFTVPYDFDYCGLVNAEYAIPPEELGITSVRERLYRGFSRSMEELQTCLAHLHQKKDAFMDLIMRFDRLALREKKEMTSYLDGFFEKTNDPAFVKNTFIDEARTK
ncbi:MAG: hypothetical protein JNK14_03345 [Chitinophagaceae bacterium]|nr:hypothetical protein [Chitinophagaceae bacterium]